MKVLECACLSLFISLVIGTVSCTGKFSGSSAGESEANTFVIEDSSLVGLIGEFRRLNTFLGFGYDLAKYDLADSGHIELMKEDIRMMRRYEASRLGYLKDLDEPDLSLPQEEETACYRLFMGRAFDPIRYVIRVNRHGDSVSSVTKVFLKQMIVDGYMEDTLIHLKTWTKKLNYEDWRQLEYLVYESYFWDITTEYSHSGLDGSSWRIEGCHTDSGPNRAYSGRPKYHHVYRWLPRDNSFLKAGEYFFALSPLRTSDEYFFFKPEFSDVYDKICAVDPGFAKEWGRTNR